MAAKKTPKNANSAIAAPPVMEDAEMLELAFEIAEIEVKTTELKEQRNEKSDKLLKAMKARGIKKIPVPDLGRSIDVKHDSSRSASKYNVVKRFGAEGEKFWEELKPKDRYYISVSKNTAAG